MDVHNCLFKPYPRTLFLWVLFLFVFLQNMILNFPLNPTLKVCFYGFMWYVITFTSFILLSALFLRILFFYYINEGSAAFFKSFPFVFLFPFLRWNSHLHATWNHVHLTGHVCILDRIISAVFCWEDDYILLTTFSYIFPLLAGNFYYRNLLYAVWNCAYSARHGYVLFNYIDVWCAITRPLDDYSSPVTSIISVEWRSCLR
mgnify:CR=1 FL=1